MRDVDHMCRHARLPCGAKYGLRHTDYAVGETVVLTWEMRRHSSAPARRMSKPGDWLNDPLRSTTRTCHRGVVLTTLARQISKRGIAVHLGRTKLLLSNTAIVW
jgi:hypothetical protein